MQVKVLRKCIISDTCVGNYHTALQQQQGCSRCHSWPLLSSPLLGVGLEVWCQVTGHLPSPEVSESDGSLSEQKVLEIGTISPTVSLPQGTD